MPLNPRLISGIAFELAEAGIVAPHEQLVDWAKTLEMDRHFVEESSYYDLNDADNITVIGGLDTCVRERVLDALSIQLTGMEWPMNLHSEEYVSTWLSSFEARLERLGWKFQG